MKLIYKLTPMKNIYLLFLLFCSYFISNSQNNVGIGTNTPNASAKLDITDANKGMLIPRVALTATNAAGPITSPAASLLVYNTASASSGATFVSPGYYYWDGAKWIRLLNSKTVNANNGLSIVGDTLVQLGGTLIQTTTITQGSNIFKIENNGTTNTIINLSSTGDFDVQDNGTSALFVKDDGNVGIGTTTPGQKLEVYGNVSVPGSVGNYSIYTWANNDANWRIGMHNANANVGFTRSLATSHVQYVTYSNGVGQGFAAGDKVSGLSSFEVTGAGSNYNAYFRGSVGLGTNPGYPLHVYRAASTGDWMARYTNGASNVYLAHGSGYGIHVNTGNTSSTQYALELHNGTSQILLARNDGNVGIGTSTPARRLEVNNTMKFTNSSADANDGVFGNAPFSSGLNLVGINDGGGRVTKFWGGLQQQENSNNNLFIGTTRIGIAVGPTSNLLSFGDGAYLQIGEWQQDDRLTIKGNVWPETAGSFDCGNGSHYWYTVYADDHDYKGVFGYTFDVYDDLKLLHSIKSTRFMDPKLGHVVEVVDPTTWPKCITNYEDKDYNPAEPFLSGKKTFGLLMGAARQLDKETKQRDERLNAKADIIASAVGIDFNSTTIEKTIEDFGSVSSKGNTLSITFSNDFKKQLHGKLPVVIISPTVSSSDYYVSTTTSEGFTVKTNSEMLSFNWLAKAKVNINLDNTKNVNNLNNIFYTEPINLDGNYPLIEDKSPKDEKK
ncbi:MAG: hypothetical protein KA174_12130 [Chitinophagales bacterium]|nr:hypothetical protein [Chitinophagales bacterium]